MTRAPRVLFATMSAPSAEGQGGHHRSYQIVHDLEALVGAEQVTTLCLSEERGSPTGARTLGWKKRRLSDLIRNRRRVRGGSDYSPRAYVEESGLERYRRSVEARKPDVCLTDHSGIAAGLLPLNERAGIPTVIVPQNIESLDWVRPGRLATAIADLGDELSILSACTARLCISRVEAGFLGGLGLPSRYYPYRPVAELESTLLKIRAERAARREPGLLLLLGSAVHRTTGESFAWLLRGIREHGLPPGVTLLVAGKSTESLLPRGESVPGVKVLGTVPPAVLREALTRAVAVLVPQRRGFGALTRLSEMSCAGIPFAVSEHACLALDLPPGASPVGDDPADWRDALAAMAAAVDTPLPAYVAWRDRQRGLPGDVFRSSP